MRAWALRFQASLRELSPDQVALLISVGLVLGVFPIMGCPTVLCLLAAVTLRLNLGALQLLNNITSPIQLALLFPLARAGAWLRPGAGNGGSAADRLGAAAVHAVAGWTCICVPLGGILYVILLYALRRSRTLWFNDLKSPS